MTTRSSKRHVGIHYINAHIDVKPQGGGGGPGYPWEIESASFSLGGDFNIRALPRGREFDIATTCFGQKVVPRGCLLYTSPSPRDQRGSRMPSSA